MKHFWLNDSEPDDNGNYTAQVQDDNGAVLSTYKGNSIKAVADQLLASNAHATGEIGRLKGSRQPDRAPAAPVISAPRQLSADDRFRLSVEINDPDKTSAAIEEIITATTGAAPQVIGSTIAKIHSDESLEWQRTQVHRFVQDNPDYFPDDRNKEKLGRTLQLKGLDLTSNNLQIVYDELHAAGLLIERPPEALLTEEVQEQQQEQQQGARQGANPPTEPNPPRQVTRPRQVSATTGFRSTDASAQRPTSQPKPKFTKADVYAMSAEVYAANYRDTSFRQLVDGWGRR